MTLPLAKALKEWEARETAVAAEAPVIKLYGGISTPDGKKLFINKLDTSLGTLKECEQLALSTNQIDRMFPMSGMKKLRILSLSRNNLKKIEKLDDVADTLEELWLSYNNIASLDGVGGLGNLRVLYLSNNNIRDWNELEKLAGLTELRDLLLVGNPIYEGLDRVEAKLSVLRRVPQLMKIDGEIVKDSDRELASSMA